MSQSSTCADAQKLVHPGHDQPLGRRIDLSAARIEAISLTPSASEQD
jgi:hypothetical protein